jgi:hypothetical protein
MYEDYKPLITYLETEYLLQAEPKAPLKKCISSDVTSLKQAFANLKVTLLPDVKLLVASSNLDGLVAKDSEFEAYQGQLETFSYLREDFAELIWSVFKGDCDRELRLFSADFKQAHRDLYL